MSQSEMHTRIIRNLALAEGFEFCGIARAERLDEDARRLENWLLKGYQAEMKYMENHFELRVNPCLLVPGARSVITLLLNYFPETTGGYPKVSKYAYGEDYHNVIRDKLNRILAECRSQIGEINGRGFVDSAPVLERSWAVRSGMGWIGKNGNFLTARNGSFYFIATLITDLELEYDDPFAKDFCGTCTRCIDACPTQAILPDKVVDGSKCISYFTIELKQQLIPEKWQQQFDDWLFGCDTCQDVCPWNRFSKPNNELRFTPLPEILNFSSSDWEELTEESFKKIFRNSPLRRSKFAGIKRNLHFLNSHQ